MDDREIVSALRASLADKVGQDRFDLWFGGSTRLLLRDSALTVEVPSRFVQDWMRSRFRKEIEASCEETLGKPVSLEFRVDEALSQVKPATVVSKPRLMVEPDPESEAAASAAPAALPGRRFAALGTFVVGASNRVAQAAAQMVVERPGVYTPLVLYGPTGVGKTHLLEGIWSATRQRRRGAQVLYLTAEQFTTFFLDALRGSGLPSFRRKYRSAELLIIDDLQFLAGKRATQVELLHTIDTLGKEGRQMVFGADRAPHELTDLGPELVTRLSGGMACRLDPPDQPTRLGIARTMASDLNIAVPEDVLHYVAVNLSAHARELRGALNRLQATSQALRQPISREMAEEVLADMVRHSGKVVKLADIEKAVCNVFGLDPSSLQSDRKAKTVSHPRMLAMWLARKHTRSALSEIGSYFGRRSHSTVISAQKKVSDWMSKQSAVDFAADKKLTVDDAIRRVEEILRAG